MTVEISAIICTRNRADFLRQCVESLLKQSLPKGSFEIVVVDNGSTDNTARLLNALKKENPDIRCLYEHRKGLSFARNTGWRHARGRIMAFLDDDAVAASDWLEKILKTFRESALRLGAVGGRSKALWSKQRPRWLVPRIEFFLGLFDIPFSPKPLNGTGMFLLGNNIAFTKEALAKIGGFDVSLGRTGEVLLSGEESLCQKQLEAKGYIYFFHPDIIINHHVIAKRISRRYFIRWAFGYGLSMARLSRILDNPPLAKRLRKGAKHILDGLGGFLALPWYFFHAAKFHVSCFAVVGLGKGIGYLIPGAKGFQGSST